MIDRLIIVGAIGLFVLLPKFANPYFTTLLLPAFGYGIALLGMNLLLGYGGLLTFGHALFVALGAYTSAYLTSYFGVRSFEIVIVAGAAVAALLAVPIGLLCVRYVKIFFGILTLAFSMLFYSFLFKFYHITGGDEGIRVFRPHLLGFDTSNIDTVEFLTGPFYYYSFGMLIIVALVIHVVGRSPFGLRLRAIRDNAQKATYLGIEVMRYRFIAFVIAGMCGAIGGAILSVPVGLADPGFAFWVQSGNLVFMLLLGGYTNFFGPVVGAVIFIFLQDHMMSLTEYWRFFFGVILIAIVVFMPYGVMGLVDRRKRWSI